MYLTELRIENFRNFSCAELSFDEHINIFFGENGAGKSSLFESIHLFGFGRSFRSSDSSQVIKYDSDSTTIHLKSSNQSQSNSLGIQINRKNGFLFSLNGERSKRKSDIAGSVPLLFLSPMSSELIYGSPANRRRFIDWLVFHVEHVFGNTSNRYNKALSHRNALLKECGIKGKDKFHKLDHWTKILFPLGNKITELRIRFISELNLVFSSLMNEFDESLDVKLLYNPGWSEELDFEQYLTERVEIDLIRGSTSGGPHRADILIKALDRKASEVLSRGQQRVVSSVLMLAKAIVLNKTISKSPVIIIDDICAELDENHRIKLVSIIRKLDAQLFISAIDKEQLNFMERYNNKKMFHVKQNSVFEEKK